jgi:hypothetical protein
VAARDLCRAKTRSQPLSSRFSLATQSPAVLADQAAEDLPPLDSGGNVGGAARLA